MKPPFEFDREMTLQYFDQLTDDELAQVWKFADKLVSMRRATNLELVYLAKKKGTP